MMVRDLPVNIAGVFAGLRYIPIAELGRGATADVWLAVSRGAGGFNKLVVIKMLRPELNDQGDMRECFLAEARLCSLLNHPSVVQVYEVLEVPQTVLLVMEYLEGQTLAKLMQVSRLSLPQAVRLRLISDALAGLHYSHELTNVEGEPLNLVHRDATPQNVFVTTEGEVKVLDFGIAKVAQQDRTQAGIVKGKIRYMPPEQFACATLDRRVDVYAIGCALWELSVGRRMWGKLNDREVARHVIQGQIPRPGDYADIDRHLEAIIAKATAPNRDDRYSTALEFQDDLQRHVARTMQPARRDVIADIVQTYSRTELATLKARIADVVSRLEDYQEDDSTRLSMVDSEEEKRGESTRRQTATVLDVPQRLSQDNAERTGGRKRLVAIAAAALVLLGVGGFLLLPSLTSSEAEPDAAEAPRESLVTLVIRAEPHWASVALDGEPLEGNPAATRVRADASSHTIEVTASGHMPLKRAVRLDRNLELNVALVPVEETAAPPPGEEQDETEETNKPKKSSSSSRRYHRRTPAPPPATGKPDCSPPYRVIDRVKVYKPECL